MLELAGVTKTYPGTAESVCVLDGVNLTIEPGQSVSITGPSGSGKTTLLNLIGGLDKLSSGQIFLNRTNLASLQEGELARLRNTQIGFVFQLHYLLPQCTAVENVILPSLARKLAGTEKAQIHEHALELLDKVGLRKYADVRPGQLSGGQRQRVAVARALINRPQLLLADEPTGSLDAETAEQIVRLLLELNRSENVTLIVASHSQKLAEQMRRKFRVDHQQVMEIDK